MQFILTTIQKYLSFFDINVKTVFAFSISGFLFWLLIKQSSIELQQIPKIINSWKSLALMLLAMSLFILMVYFHSLRTRILFTQRNTSFNSISSFPSLAIGNLYNCLLPGNMGEVARALHFSRINKISLNSTIAVFVIEKLIDATLCIPLFLILFWFQPFVNHIIQYAFIAVFLGVIGIMSATFLIIRFGKVKKLFFSFIPTRKIRHIAFKIYCETLRHFRRMTTNRTIYLFALLCYAMFFTSLLQYYLVMESLSIPKPILHPFTAYFLALSMVIIAFIPSAPGNLGVAHYGLYASLALVAELNHVAATPALKQQFAFAGICIHFSYFLPEILVGFYYLFREHKILFNRTPL
jgi:uncharacterized protein (TIRG00374 family)